VGYNVKRELGTGKKVSKERRKERQEGLKDLSLCSLS
jgi:hypothetical protein